MPDYSIGARVLHHMALDWPIMGEMAFDVERSLFLKSSPDPIPGKHVFVSGLARAGTTILMREVHKSDQFASLTYADMPFVLCPNAWNIISRRSSKERPAEERAHGDGILVDVNSPEALDEVFWRVFARQEYIKCDGLYPHTPDEETLSYYRDYIRLVLRHRKKTRYLSKNNNNILRISALHRQFPNAVFLVPVREPLSHAQSLLSQHRRFLSRNGITRRYMIWLGHHEFGAAHRPFVLDAGSARFTDASSLDYWLEQWVRCYSYLDQVSQVCRDRTYFVPYERLCNLPVVWKRITEVIDVDDQGTTQFKKSEKTVEESPDPQMTKTAGDLYSRIRQRALEKLGVDTQDLASS